MSKKGRVVSTKYIKREFTTIGLIFCLYIILVLYLPSLIELLINSSPNLTYIANNQYLFVGIIYLLFVVGTLVPTAGLFLTSKVKVNEIWRNSNCRFKDIIISTIILISLVTASMFLVSVLNTYLPLGERVLSPIGLNFDTDYLFNPLYIFLFVVVSPILEEFAFRGVLLRMLGKYGNRFAMWSTALFYALLHVSIAEMLPAFIMSLFLTKMTLRYRSVQPTIIVHILFNAFMYGYACIPLQYYLVMAVTLFLLYFLSIVFLFTKAYRYVRINKHTQSSIVWTIFLTRPATIFAILLVIIHSILMSVL